MSRKDLHHGERRVRVVGVRKDPPYVRRLGRALIELARLEEETASDTHPGADRSGSDAQENSKAIKADRGDTA